MLPCAIREAGPRYPRYHDARVTQPPPADISVLNARDCLSKSDSEISTFNRGCSCASFDEPGLVLHAR